MTKEITAFGLFVLFGLAIGGTALAIGEVPPATIPDNITSAQNFIDLIDNIVDWIFVVVLVFAVIFIVLAGLQFIKLLWGAVGIAVAVLARGLVTAVRSLIGS
ncbi:MAG: hypothetical protein UY25_C0001G0169 [Candidatus Yanofskybacteria bacterium GW2011_GWC1_48_11]|uniref:TrbC/VIRB2 family protein n=1 Tax=Candidatus Yanofskybacteria bacterium GW2011_GWC1_48_11 TaxID=1619027 RepID=A0A837IM48_9BACT|nr:MAG: hypothetical protein UY25_C0001G0169 [Candidatus Yanofskybacteria bacterium GW2011_GWC1_48_11]